MKSKNFISPYILVSVFALLLWGCGNNQGGALNKSETAQDPLKAMQRLQANSYSLSDDEVEQEWRCPNSDNVFDVGIANYSGQNNYKVCVHREQLTRFLIRESTPTGSTRKICVYPLQKSSAQYQVLGSAQCGDLGTGLDLDLTFGSLPEGSSANYIFITLDNFKSAANSCLGLVSSLSGNPSACPPHAEGLVQ